MNKSRVYCFLTHGVVLQT